MGDRLDKTHYIWHITIVYYVPIMYTVYICTYAVLYIAYMCAYITYYIITHTIYYVCIYIDNIYSIYFIHCEPHENEILSPPQGLFLVLLVVVVCLLNNFSE